VTAVDVKPSPKGVPGAVTEPDRLRAEDIVYPGHGGEGINGYIVRPTGAERLPGMVVIHEAGGLGEHIRDVCNRIAQLGHVALGVDLYTREGSPPPAGDMPAILERLFSMPDARVLGDLEGAADHLRARSDLSGRVGCIGFCMGGRYALLFAASSDRLQAAVDCWGGFIDKATLAERSTPERPTPPLDLAERLSCPLLAAVGAEDQNPSPQMGAELRERAERSGQEVEVDVYDGAGHAFFADYRPSYRAGPAALLWERIVPFLHRHLQDAPPQ
jgi:carboxymethylenebutenolidase